MLDIAVVAALGQYMAAKNQREAEERLYAKMRAELSPEAFEDWKEIRNRRIEHSHQRKMNDDKCEAIESTSFWRFGRSYR